MPIMTAALLEEIRLTTPSRHDPLLDLYHNTRHASRRHALLRGMKGWQVRSPWLSRFDWVIDAHLEAEPGARGPTVLTKRRETPRSVFVKAGWLDSFVEHLLPALEKPVAVYMGNANHALSKCAGGVHRLLGHPMVRAIFCENKDLDLSPVTAMPVGLHPADMLHEAGALRLRAFGSEADPADKERRIFVPYGGATARFGAAVEAPDLAPEVMFPYDGIDKLEEYWRCLARCRFLLAPWELPHDSPAPFEALILGAIPILRAGPLAEAYRGLPVVTVGHLSQITPKKLDEWWEMYAGGFADAAITSPAYWWSKVAARLPGRKRAFLVLGPESHGNHLVTDLLVHAGCHGRSGNHVPWSGEWQEGIDDRQPWDEKLPTDEDPIVWRRSVPHLKHWPDIRGMIDVLERRGYTVHAIVVHRDRYAAIQSQLKWRHVADPEVARANIERAYPYIFAHLQAAAVKSTVVNYESLAHYPAAQDDLLEELGLDAPSERLEVWDANRKWYDARAEHPQVVLPKTPAAARRCADFPEWSFPCDPSVRLTYEKRVAAGRERMRTSSVVFCGLARDVAGVLPQVTARIEHAGGMFGDYRVVIYENDSCDGTVARLREWEESNPRVSVLSETLGAARWGRVCDLERMRYLAARRNRYLEHATERYGAFDYLIVLDTDLPSGFSYEGLAHTFGGEEWHVVGSNLLSLSALSEGPAPPRPEFFDAWAFRRPGDVEPRPFAEINALFFQRGEPLVPVWSAFGGLAVYSMAAIRSGARYGGDDCEHVVLHRRLRERGFDRQFLNPSQIVLYVEGPS
jgi:hypothetical protein